jgi:alkaline phosphatase D
MGLAGPKKSSMRPRRPALAALSWTLLAALPAPALAEPAFGQGIMVGEVSATTAVVQVRVTDGTELVDGDFFEDGDALRDGDLPGTEGKVRFRYRPIDIEGHPYKITEWVGANPENDHYARIVLSDLQPGTRYACLAELQIPGNGAPADAPRVEARFRTHPGKDSDAPVRFAMTSCYSYIAFMGTPERPERGYKGEDRHLGFPGAESLLKQNPDFVIHGGDVVYYDRPPVIETHADMRAKWHRQAALPRMMALHAAAPGYWMKDDHDHRRNDSDATKDYFPSHELAIQTFREQVPVVPPNDDETPTYRTYRVSKDLQIWFVEGRDYRDPNRQADGPDKTLWGDKQLVWLKQSMLASDATFRVLVSPTPMVGPDDNYKNDNHTNPSGYRTEGDAFKAWGKENDIWENTFLICGDRHWQYHSIDPSGANEFCCGAFNDRNTRMGRKPGDPGSTDPDGMIQQPYMYPKKTGGFLMIGVEPGESVAPPTIKFEFFDDEGTNLYTFSPNEA